MARAARRDEAQDMALDSPMLYEDGIKHHASYLDRRVLTGNFRHHEWHHARPATKSDAGFEISRYMHE